MQNLHIGQLEGEVQGTPDGLLQIKAIADS